MAVRGFWGAETGGIDEAVASLGSPSATGTNARTGNYCYSLTTGNWLSFVEGNPAVHYGTIGFAYRRTSDFSAIFAYVLDAAAAVTNIYLKCENDDTVTVGVSTDRFTSSATLPLNTWVYIELVLQSGSVELFMDGVSQGSYSGTIVQAAGIRFYQNCLVDDIYISNDTTPLGDCEVKAYLSGRTTAVPESYIYTSATTLDSGTWADTQEVPFNDTNFGAYTGGSSDGVVIGSGTPSGGIPSDTSLDGTIEAIKVSGRLARSGGSGTAQYLTAGYWTVSGYVGAISGDLDISTAVASYQWYNSTSPPTTSQHAAVGVYKDGGGQDYEIYELIGQILHVPATTGPQTITCTGIASAEALGTLTVQRGTVTVSAAGDIASAEAFGSAKLNLTIFPETIATAEVFGTQTVLRGTVTVVPDAIASAEAFGTQTVLRGTVTLVPTGITSEESFGTLELLLGAAKLFPTGIASAEAFGTTEVLRGTITLVPTSIDTAEAVGALTLSNKNTIIASGIASAAAVGGHEIVIGVWAIIPTGIASLESIGTHAVTNFGGVQYINPNGLITREAFGTPTVVPGVATIIPSGITSAEVFGTATAILEPYIISGTGIVSGEAFGSQKLNMFIPIGPNGIASEEAIGTDIAVEFASIICTGIPSEEAFGTCTVTGGTREWDPGDITQNITRWITKDINATHNEEKLG